MRLDVLLATAVLGSSASAAGPAQQILNDLKSPFESVAKPVTEAWSKSLSSLSKSMEGMSAEAKAIWNEVAMLYPEDMTKATFLSSPKPHKKRPASAWDYIVKGEDVQSVWVQNSKGESEREIDGKLATYNLRAKKVDPTKLGVDTVKQYSGYLDDEENDKHLFYCMQPLLPKDH